MIRKNIAEILSKLNIQQLNSMQLEAMQSIQEHSNVVVLSPTGTGKTLGFLLPILDFMEVELEEVQTLIIVPTRELALQIEQVLRKMGTGYKVNAIYGGRTGQKDKLDLRKSPALLIGTPGRLADRIRRGDIAVNFVSTLILDEFDKSLEIGFTEEMRQIIGALPMVRRRILTSATQKIAIPEFLQCNHPKVVNFLDREATSQLEMKLIMASDKDKLDTLVATLDHLGDQPGIIFCNFKETIQRVSAFLTQHQIAHGCFHVDMEQIDRERTLIKFRNGTLRLIVATDLAARGLDIPEIKFILHYQLPQKNDEFIHRNGRTARMNSAGTAYILKGPQEDLPDFIDSLEVAKWTTTKIEYKVLWQTIFVSGGRKDKISKGDIAGLFLKQGQLSADDLGIIEIKQDCAFVGVKAVVAEGLIALVNNTRLKKKKVRLSIV